MPVCAQMKEESYRRRRTVVPPSYHRRWSFSPRRTPVKMFGIFFKWRDVEKKNQLFKRVLVRPILHMCCFVTDCRVSENHAGNLSKYCRIKENRFHNRCIITQTSSSFWRSFRVPETSTFSIKKRLRQLKCL